MGLISDYNPLNGNLRRQLARFIKAVVVAAQPVAPTPAPDPVAGAQRVVSAAMQHASRTRGAGGPPPPSVASAGWTLAVPDLLRTDEEQAAIWASVDAKYGRATTTYGTTPQAMSTLSATDLTVERIAYIHREVDQSGYLVRKGDLDFDLHRRDGKLQTVQRQRAAFVYKNALQYKPRNPRSRVSVGVCNFVRHVVDAIPAFCKAEEELLWSGPGGYAAQEIVWAEPRAITFPVGKGYATAQNAKRIASLEWVHNRDFRWHWIERRWLLDTGGARYVDPFTSPEGEPTRKLIMHHGYGVGDPHQRGYMFPASYLSMFKHQSLGRWLVMLELFGINTPYIVTDVDGYLADEDAAAALDFLGNLGRGVPAILNKRMGEVKMTETPTGVDARGQHAAIVGWIDSALAQLGAGQTLTMDIGGTGSYGAADVHADSKEDVQIIEARLEAETIEHQLLLYIVEENIEQLAAALGATPDQIRAEVPRCYRTVDRRIDPAQRLKMFIDAKKDLGMDIDPEQVAQELNFRVIEAALEDDEQQPATEKTTEQPAALELTATAQAAIVTVNEAREGMGLGILTLSDGTPDPDGSLTIAEFAAKHSGVISDAAAAEQGDQ